MNTLCKLFCAAGLSLASVAALADNCDTARNTFDEFYCKDKLYIQADKDLNKAYGELMKALPSASKTLKSVQLEWMRGRDSQCIEERDDEIVLFVNCRLRKTVEQTNFYKTACANVKAQVANRVV